MQKQEDENVRQMYASQSTPRQISYLSEIRFAFQTIRDLGLPLRYIPEIVTITTLPNTIQLSQGLIYYAVIQTIIARAIRDVMYDDPTLTILDNLDENDENDDTIDHFSEENKVYDTLQKCIYVRQSSQDSG